MYCKLSNKNGEFVGQASNAHTSADIPIFTMVNTITDKLKKRDAGCTVQMFFRFPRVRSWFIPASYVAPYIDAEFSRICTARYKDQIFDVMPAIAGVDCDVAVVVVPSNAKVQINEHRIAVPPINLFGSSLILSKDKSLPLFDLMGQCKNVQTTYSLATLNDSMSGVMVQIAPSVSELSFPSMDTPEEFMTKVLYSQL